MPKLAHRFEPHAIVLVETPSPLFVAGWLGTDDLRIELPRSLPSAVWLRYALSKVADLNEFWKPKGLMISYTQTFSVEYSLSGEVVRTMDRAVDVPLAYLAMMH